MYLSNTDVIGITFGVVAMLGVGVLILYAMCKGQSWRERFVKNTEEYESGRFYHNFAVTKRYVLIGDLGGTKLEMGEKKTRPVTGYYFRKVPRHMIRSMRTAVNYGFDCFSIPTLQVDIDFKDGHSETIDSGWHVEDRTGDEK